MKGVGSVKTYAKRFNAQRAARAELGDDAIEGIDYRTMKTSSGWTWEQDRKPAAALTASKPEAQQVPQYQPPTTTPARHHGKRAVIEAAARDGALPEPPDFSAETHRRFRPKLAKLIEMATAGDVAGLQAIQINPISTSPRAMQRYRELCMIALKAQRHGIQE
jgi:hypothetical protein